MLLRFVSQDGRVSVYTEYVSGPLPVDVDASDTRRGDDVDDVNVDQSASETNNRTSDTSPAAGRQ